MRVVYGPLGAGKSTLLGLLAEGVEELAADALAIYINHDEGPSGWQPAWRRWASGRGWRPG